MRSAKYELVPAGAGLRGDAESARLLEAANDEIDRLRSAIRRLAEQDATLSVCDGAVTVTMDAALTDAEREAVWFAIAYAQVAGHECEAALRGLLERTK
jgi:hypothetical protein